MAAAHTLSFPSTPLLPCPFCGHAGTWFRTGRDVGVECADGGDCPGRAQTNVYEPDLAEHAAGQWNTRDDQAADHYEDVLQTREELLAALQGLVTVAEGKTLRPGADWKLIDAARAAIARAAGAKS